MQMIMKLASLALLLTSVTFAKADPPQEPQEIVRVLANEDLLAVGYVDLNSIDIAALVKWGEQQKLITPESIPDNQQDLDLVQGFISQITEAGADHVIAFVQQQDLQRPPLIAVSIAEGKNPRQLLANLQAIMALARIPDFELEIWNGFILGGSAEQIARAKNTAAVERPNLVKAWEQFAGHDAAVMIVGSPETRRVIRELFPPLDAPFENVTGPLIADKMTSIGVSIDLPEDLGAQLVVQTEDKNSAKVFSDSFEQIKEILVSTEGEYSATIPKIGITAISAVEPEIKGNDLVLDLSPILNGRVKLAELFEPAFKGSRATQSLNNLRMIILAMLNYEFAHQSLPAYANFDAAGKPLLSWRVHILPFLEQGELYNQFKLDEPWNSEHNIKLVDKMPDFYADPSQILAHLNQAGKTRIVVPFGPGTMFEGNEGVTFKQIFDGSSNTIAIATVVPDKAVVWTQPTDWNVDLENPHAGLFDDSTQETRFARADGSVTTIVSSISADQLKALLTKDGGENPK